MTPRRPSGRQSRRVSIPGSCMKARSIGSAMMPRVAALQPMVPPALRLRAGSRSPGPAGPACGIVMGPGADQPEARAGQMLEEARHGAGIGVGPAADREDRASRSRHSPRRPSRAANRRRAVDAPPRAPGRRARPRCVRATGSRHVAGDHDGVGGRACQAIMAAPHHRLSLRRAPPMKWTSSA